MAVTLCLLGRLAIEVDGVAADGARLGALGRTALAYLALERRRPVPRHELADVLWGEHLPATWESALRGVVSRVRATLSAAGLPVTDVLRSELGCYQLHLPPGVRIDVEEVTAAVARAEALLEQAPDRARREAAWAAERAARQFLPGARGAWAEGRQAELAAVHVRALEALIEAASRGGDHAEAVAAGARAIELAPLRESAHQRLMAAHARAGNRAAALRAYQRCREVLADELGVHPSPETEALYLRLLADEPLAPSGTSAPIAETNLPATPTTFVGRDREVAELRRLLGSTRLLTLTGPGGVGKSRLSLRLASEQAGEHPDGVWLVELAALADPSLVAPAVLAVLGVPEVGPRAEDVLVGHLSGRHVLLVLDNCEHLVGACASLADVLLRRCADVRLLATSREPLGVVGEMTWAVPPLTMPEAVQLFTERAAAAVPGLDVTGAAADVERICSQLDGIPLAIELAAARTRAMSIAEIAARLGDRLKLLVGGPRASPDRHQTLRATIDWSFSALPAPERSLFERLSVFAGSCTLVSAETVCGCPEIDVLEALSALVDKSLVVVDRDGDDQRYRMLDTLRQYADEQLEAAGGKAESRDRHLAWAVALGEEAERELEGGGQQRWLPRLDSELDNLRAALDWAEARRAVGEGLRLTGSLVRYWEIRGFFAEGRSRLEALASLEDGPPPLRAKALNGAAVLAQRQGDVVAARSLYEESLVIRRALGDRAGAATALHGLANLAVARGDLVTARSLFEENFAIARELGLERMMTASLMNLGVVAQYSFMYGHRPADEAGPEAAAYYGESLERYRRKGDRYGEAMALENLGALRRLYPGDVDGARALHEQSLAIRRELGDKQGIAASARYVAALALRSGEITTARRLHEERMAIERELGNIAQVAEAAADLAEIAVGEGDLDEAHRLLDASRSTFDEVGNPWWSAKVLSLQGDLARRRGELDDAQRHLDECRAIARDIGGRDSETWSIVLLARLARSRGRRDDALALAREALALAEAHELRGAEAAALDVLAGVACDLDELDNAARLAGAAQALRGMVPVGPDTERAADVASVRARLGDDRFAAAWADGLAMTPGARRALARGDVSP